MAMIAYKCSDIQVTVVDLNQQRIDAWNSETLPIYEPGLYEVVKACRGRNLFFSTDCRKHVADADIVFVRCLRHPNAHLAACYGSNAPIAIRACSAPVLSMNSTPMSVCCRAETTHTACSVNTPTKVTGVGAGKAADLAYWEGAARMIASVSTTSKIIVEKSTVPVKTAEAIGKVSAPTEASQHEPGQWAGWCINTGSEGQIRVLLLAMSMGMRVQALCCVAFWACRCCRGTVLTRMCTSRFCPIQNFSQKAPPLRTWRHLTG